MCRRAELLHNIGQQISRIILCQNYALLLHGFVRALEKDLTRQLLRWPSLTSVCPPGASTRASVQRVQRVDELSAGCATHEGQSRQSPAWPCRSECMRCMRCVTRAEPTKLSRKCHVPCHTGLGRRGLAQALPQAVTSTCTRSNSKQCACLACPCQPMEARCAGSRGGGGGCFRAPLRDTGMTAWPGDREGANMPAGKLMLALSRVQQQAAPPRAQAP